MHLTHYLALFPGATRNKARFMALAEAVLRQAADLMALTESLPSAFSFGHAEGVQLDAAAEAAGLQRESGMTDAAFRQYILSKLKLWAWDGTNEGVPAALPEGTAQTDNADGTVSVSPAGARRDVLPVPAGVRVNS